MTNHRNGAAGRLARSIGVIKWITIALCVLGMVLVAATVHSAVIGLPVFFGGAAYAVTAWVVFGWFEHTLRLLVAIANGQRA